MIIPHNFRLFGETYKVKKLVKIDKKDSWGEYDAHKNIIKIKKGLNNEQQEQVYLHELMHCIFANLGYDNLDEDEKLIDRVAKALHQILTSGK